MADGRPDRRVKAVPKRSVNISRAIRRTKSRQAGVADCVSVSVNKIR